MPYISHFCSLRRGIRHDYPHLYDAGRRCVVETRKIALYEVSYTYDDMMYKVFYAQTNDCLLESGVAMARAGPAHHSPPSHFGTVERKIQSQKFSAGYRCFSDESHYLHRFSILVDGDTDVTNPIFSRLMLICIFA